MTFLFLVCAWVSKTVKLSISIGLSSTKKSFADYTYFMKHEIFSTNYIILPRIHKTSFNAKLKERKHKMYQSGGFRRFGLIVRNTWMVKIDLYLFYHYEPLKTDWDSILGDNIFFFNKTEEIASCRYHWRWLVSYFTHILFNLGAKPCKDFALGLLNSPFRNKYEQDCSKYHSKFIATGL